MTRRERLLAADRAMKCGQWPEAARLLQGLLAEQPQDYASQVNLGAALINLGRLADAAAQTRAAIAAGHRQALLYQRMDQLLIALARPATERLTNARAWLAVSATSAEAQVALGHAERALGNLRAARIAFETAARLDPQHLAAAWAAFQYPDEVVFADEPAMTAYAEQFRRGLATFAAQQFTRDASLGKRALLALGASVPFHLVYLPDDDLALLSAYGDQLRRLALAAGFADLDPATRPSRSRPRVLVLSAHLHQHSVARVWRDLLLALPTAEFELIAVHLSTQEDASTAAWRARCDGYFAYPGGIPQAVQLLRQLAADVIVYLDLGMEPMASALASLRLAPVQAVTWAHPISSGLPMIDYFLSSDAAEPANGETFYRERLVRLPGLACSYRFPLARPAPTAMPAADVDVLRLVCAQIGYKLTPAHDAYVARLLDLDPRIELWLLPNLKAPALLALQTRMRASLGEARYARLRWQDALPFEAYLALLQSAFVVIDSLDFSGGLTSLDALSLGLPIVTVEGRRMRGRQTAAMLRTLAVPELIAADVERALGIVQRLLNDAHWHRQIRDRIGANRERLSDCTASIEGLAAFLRQASRDGAARP